VRTLGETSAWGTPSDFHHNKNERKNRSFQTVFSEAEKKTSKKTSKKKNKKKNKKKKIKKKNKMMIVSAGGADENKAERRCLMNVARTHALSLPLCLRALFFSFFFFCSSVSRGVFSALCLFVRDVFETYFQKYRYPS